MILEALEDHEAAVNVLGGIITSLPFIKDINDLAGTKQSQKPW